MNIPVLIAGILSLVAFLVHAFMGSKENKILKPDTSVLSKEKETWIQIVSGWNWVGVDLFLSGILFILVACTDIISAKKEILFLLSIYFLLCGIVWLCSVLLSKNSNKQVFVLGQWIFCLIVSGLVFWGQA